MRCAYCTEHLPAADLQAEHVTPLSRGGDNGLNNILPSCAPCNSDKRDLLLSEWNTDRERRGLPPRITTWSDTDARYQHLTQAVALVA
ncbi:HNH endonuclease [Microbacterium sp. BE35]|uniref:HNH endonuclease n=1 Tax=Microbacterium sp. BE35 TaxID=2817773 RepID=UPI0037C7E4F5